MNYLPITVQTIVKPIQFQLGEYCMPHAKALRREAFFSILNGFES